MTSAGSTSALLLIEVQQGFDDLSWWGARNNPGAEANMARLLAAWRTGGRPVFQVKHNSRNPRSPLHPGNAGNAIKPGVAPLPGEPVLEKDVNSSFIGTDLEARLRQAGVTGLVIAEADHPALRFDHDAHGGQPRFQRAAGRGCDGGVRLEGS